MATLGKSTIGGTANPFATDFDTVAGPYAIAENGTIQSIHIYTNSTITACVLGVYEDVAGTPGDLVVEVTGSGSAGWLSIAATGALESGKSYWIAFNLDAASGPSLQYDAGSKGLKYKAKTYNGTLPDPWDATGNTDIPSRDYSAYITYEPDGGEPATSITVDDPADYSVLQRGSSDTASVTITGDYTGTPDHIQARVVEYGTTTEAVTWTTIDASPSGDSFSGSLTVPAGGWYAVQVRSRDGSDVVIDTDEGSNHFGVGVLVGFAGQSNAALLFESGSAETANDRVVRYNQSGWSQTVGGDGAIAFANAIEAVLDMPVAMLDYGVSSAGLVADGDLGYGYWLDDTSGEPKQEFLAGLTATADGKIEAIVWIQGESECIESVSGSEYAGLGVATDGLAALFSIFRSTVTAPDGSDIPIIMSVVGRSTNETPPVASWQAIRDAQMRVAEAVDGCYLTNAYDLEYVDVYHLTPTAYVEFGERIAGSLSIALGEVDQKSNGPRLLAVSAGDTTSQVVLTYDQDLTTADTTYSTQGWRFVDADDNVVTVSSVAKSAARQVTLGLGSAVADLDGCSLWSHYGRGDDKLAIAYPRATVTLPNSAGTVYLPAEPIAAVVGVDVPLVASSGSGDYSDQLDRIETALGNVGSAGWDETELSQIRHRLGIDGTKEAPSESSPQLTVTVASTSVISVETPNADDAGRFTITQRDDYENDNDIAPIGPIRISTTQGLLRETNPPTLRFGATQLLGRKYGTVHIIGEAYAEAVAGEPNQYDLYIEIGRDELDKVPGDYGWDIEAVYNDNDVSTLVRGTMTLKQSMGDHEDRVA